MRHLVVVLGDQLDLQASAFDGFDAERDAVWMAEVAEESTHVWLSKPHIASGRYIERMSAGSLCAQCRFRPAERAAAIRSGALKR
nr:cryptochrome/photolyase family protein [Solimonas marina]